MSHNTKEKQEDASSIVESARALMAATADVAGAKVAEARDRLVDAVETGRETVREKPFQSLGIALGVGALVGYLLGRRCASNDDSDE